MKTVMARISQEAREQLNTLADEAHEAASEYLTALIGGAYQEYVQAHCPHEWEDASTGSGDCIEEHSVCRKCGATQ